MTWAEATYDASERTATSARVEKRKRTSIDTDDDFFPRAELGRELERELELERDEKLGVDDWVNSTGCCNESNDALGRLPLLWACPEKPERAGGCSGGCGW